MPGGCNLAKMTRREGVIIGVSAGISQNSDVPELDGVVNLFTLPGGIVKTGGLYFLV